MVTLLAGVVWKVTRTVLLLPTCVILILVLPVQSCVLVTQQLILITQPGIVHNLWQLHV